MANKDYYERWLKIKERMHETLLEDSKLHHFAMHEVGLKPQGTAVEVVARVYAKFCDLYNKLCDCYDQMHQVQRRPYIKTVIDALTCRIIELKQTLQMVEAFEYTYPDNALQQLIMVPQDIQIMCPFFYPFEIRREEMQYVIDQIFEGNRIGDPLPRPSDVEREEKLLEEERKLLGPKESEKKRKFGMEEEIEDDDNTEVKLTPEEIEAQSIQAEYQNHLMNIQRMERMRASNFLRTQKKIKDIDLYLELAELKKPDAKESMRIKAASLIKLVYRQFMELKRVHDHELKVKQKLGMVISAWKPRSAKERLEEVKAVRREFRKKYYDEWLKANVKEKSRIFRLKEGNVMEDISDEIRDWFVAWYKRVRTFDEFPWPLEGGSILVVRGETFTVEEYIEWAQAEEKRLNAGSSAEQAKADKAFAKAEKKRLAKEESEKEKKRLADYKKMRRNPDIDPGVIMRKCQAHDPLMMAWHKYETQWSSIDQPNAPREAVKGYLRQLITENAYMDLNIELRPIVDEMMRLELQLLKKSLKSDRALAGLDMPLAKKRKRPKNPKEPKPDKLSPANMFQQLADAGIVKQYPKKSLDDFWGDNNYAAADMRAIMWTPKFPPPCMGDVREHIRVQCLLTLGSSCQQAVRSQILVGPKGSGKRTLIYAIASETNSILIDLSPMNLVNKFPSNKALKSMFHLVNKVSRLMQPTIIMVDMADKIFYKKVPNEEKWMDPTRLQKDFYKEIIRPLKATDKILVLGTATQPWLSKSKLVKCFPAVILLPRTDYASISFILLEILMKYHGMDREFNVHSTAQALRGYDIYTIKSAIDRVLTGERVAALYHRPLHPSEIIEEVLNSEQAMCLSYEDYDLYWQWYLKNTKLGIQNQEYMEMIESHHAYKLKTDKML